MNEWLTVGGIAEQTGIPEETIRRYINRHGLHLQVKKNHKSYMISSESISILVEIRKCYSDGMGADQVEDQLATTAPTIITVNESGKRMNVDIGEALSSLEKSVNERMDGQENVLKALAQLIQQQQQTAAAITLPDPRQHRHERLNERLTERRIEKQLRDESLELWAKKPAEERMRKVGLFRKKEEDVNARERFVRDYIDEHYEARMLEAYGLDDL